MREREDQECKKREERGTFYRRGGGSPKGRCAGP
jgi:hypothetical protein